MLIHIVPTPPTSWSVSFMGFSPALQCLTRHHDLDKFQLLDDPSLRSDMLLIWPALAKEGSGSSAILLFSFCYANRFSPSFPPPSHLLIHHSWSTFICSNFLIIYQHLLHPPALLFIASLSWRRLMVVALVLIFLLLCTTADTVHPRNARGQSGH